MDALQLTVNEIFTKLSVSASPSPRVLPLYVGKSIPNGQEHGHIGILYKVHFHLLICLVFVKVTRTEGRCNALTARVPEDETIKSFIRSLR